MGAKLDFFADVVQTGTVLGVDAEMGPEAVSAVLGDGFGENWNGRSYWWSYGLVEMALVVVGHDHGGALADHDLGGGAADAVGASGDQRHLVLEAHQITLRTM